MADFSFLKNISLGKWVISAPRRSQRTNTQTAAPICPFCPGQEKSEPELYRVGGKLGDANWHIRVIPNKFPFTLHHELILHSQDHHKNFDELPFTQVELILQTYRKRFNENKKKGQVYIFHNRGHAAGESLPHPHTQLTVIPSYMKTDIPLLPEGVKRVEASSTGSDNIVLDTEYFNLLCPDDAAWPDEIWFIPKQSGKSFGAITDNEITDLSFALSRVIQIFDLRHGHEFPFNFYISPDKQWYLRLIPREKILGGFEVGTGVMVNTQRPDETMAFLKEHFWEPDREIIVQQHQAIYVKKV